MFHSVYYLFIQTLFDSTKKFALFTCVERKEKNRDAGNICQGCGGG